jgi:hypothetical protein
MLAQRKRHGESQRSPLPPSSLELIGQRVGSRPRLHVGRTAVPSHPAAIVLSLPERGHAIRIA